MQAVSLIIPQPAVAFLHPGFKVVALIPTSSKLCRSFQPHGKVDIQPTLRLRVYAYVQLKRGNCKGKLSVAGNIKGEAVVAIQPTSWGKR